MQGRRIGSAVAVRVRKKCHRPAEFGLQYGLGLQYFLLLLLDPQFGESGVRHAVRLNGDAIGLELSESVPITDPLLRLDTLVEIIDTANKRCRNE